MAARRVNRKGRNHGEGSTKEPLIGVDRLSFSMLFG